MEKTFFLIWLVSLHTIILKFIHAVMYINSSFPFIAEQYSLHSPVHEHLNCVQFGAITKKATINIYPHVFGVDIYFNFSGLVT